MLYQQHYIILAGETPTAVSGTMMSSLTQGRNVQKVSSRTASRLGRDMPDAEAWTYLGGSVSMSLISLETVMV